MVPGRVVRAHHESGAAHGACRSGQRQLTSGPSTVGAASRPPIPPYGRRRWCPRRVREPPRGGAPALEVPGRGSDGGPERCAGGRDPRVTRRRAPGGDQSGSCRSAPVGGPAGAAAPVRGWAPSQQRAPSSSRCRRRRRRRPGRSRSSCGHGGVDVAGGGGDGGDQRVVAVHAVAGHADVVGRRGPAQRNAVGRRGPSTGSGALGAIVSGCGAVSTSTVALPLLAECTFIAMVPSVNVLPAASGASTKPEEEPGVRSIRNDCSTGVVVRSTLDRHSAHPAGLVDAKLSNTPPELRTSRS